MARLLCVLLLAVLVSACAPAVSDAAMEAARAVDSPILITRIDADPPNSAGGVDMKINVLNVGTRTITYILYTVELFNAVGDPVAGAIRCTSTAMLRETGPIRPGARSAPFSVWSAVLYNHSGRCIEVQRAVVTFADGRAVALNLKDDRYAEAVLAPGVQNSCRIAL